MSFMDLFNTLADYRRVTEDFQIITDLINDAFNDWLASKGISRVALVNGGKLVINVDGRLQGATDEIKGVTLHSRFLTVDLDESEAHALAESLTHYAFEGDSAYVWVIPDGYMASLTQQEQEWDAHGGGYFSHESICLSNTSDVNTRCILEVLYEDVSKNKVTCEFEVPAHRSVHYRLDKLTDDNGQPLIAKDAPVSYKVTSLDARVVVQGSRILTSGEESEFASFGSVMAWCPQQRR